MDKVKQVATIAMWCVVWCSIGCFFLWTAGSIYYFVFLPKFLSTILALIYLLGGLYLLFKTNPKSRWLSLAAMSIGLLYFVAWLQRPSTDREWDADQARMATISIDENRVTIKNFRDSTYRTESDYDAKFREFEFQLDQLTDVWFLVQRFTTLEGLAHTFITFRVESPEGPRYFSVSVEIRREKGEIYSPIQGMYRQYELIYVFGSEEDLIGVRTVKRPNDRVFMYHVNASPSQVQTLFTEIAKRANKLQQSPEFYNTFLNNCTNNIVRHTYQLTPEPINWLDPRIVLPGFSDRFAFANNLIGEKSQTFEELSEASRIDERARLHGIEPGFSSAIRSD